MKSRMGVLPRSMRGSEFQEDRVTTAAIRVPAALSPSTVAFLQAFSSQAENDRIVPMPDWKNKLFFGDNLHILRERVADDRSILFFWTAFGQGTPTHVNRLIWPRYEKESMLRPRLRSLAPSTRPGPQALPLVAR